MALEQVTIVQSIQLITRKNQLVIVLPPSESMQMLTQSIGCSLKPIGIGHRLLGSKHFDKTFGKRIESVRIGDMTVE